MSDELSQVTAYRIGWWTHAWWPNRKLLIGLLTGKQPDRRADNGSRFVGRRLFLKPIKMRFQRLRRPHRPWQAEYDGCGWCRRAWTREGAIRKAAADQQHLSQTGQWSPWVQRRLRRRYGPDTITGPRTPLHHEGEQ